jgi:hypothetical protein
MKTFLFAFIAIMLVLLLAKTVRVIVKHTVHGSRGDRRLDSEMNITCSAFFCM